MIKILIITAILGLSSPTVKATPVVLETDEITSCFSCHKYWGRKPVSWGYHTSIPGAVSLLYAPVLQSDTQVLQSDTQAPIPEPATMWLFGLGLVWLSYQMRRKK